MKKAIIFDLDGTLADITHRLHFIQGKKKDYDGFYGAVKYDTPKKDVIELHSWISGGIFAEDCHGNPDFPEIIYCSGRPDSCKEDTMWWLTTHVDNTGDFKLYMRKNGDYRPDYIVKEEILKQLQAEGYEILFTVDDRQQVVDMWRRNGITCFQCDQWEEKKPQKSWGSGKLALLVGPSGAGKTSWLGDPNNVKYWKYTVISSDDERQWICGDFKDQSQNERVWSYIHSQTKAHLYHGIDVLIDATNIKDADRKQFLKLAPKDSEIEYVVINRPLEDKLRDQGWRKDVMIKGKPLVEQHHNIFLSNLKAILAGDGDPRVTVNTEWMDNG